MIFKALARLAIFFAVYFKKIFHTFYFRNQADAQCFSGAVKSSTTNGKQQYFFFMSVCFIRIFLIVRKFDL